MLASIFITFAFVVIQRMAWSGARSAQAKPDPIQSQSYYQPSVQDKMTPYYQPYKQGYQTQRAATPVGESGAGYNTPEGVQEDAYQAYDQPKAEYPQQMPPM
ncbi:MAG: hypothetical protein NVSMB44_46300 [Ktedonobacteraceae bacterium]